MKTKGFALLEILLAIIIIAIASYGIVALFQSGSDQTSLTSVEQELNGIAYTYSNLASQGLGVTSDTAFTSLLYNSGQLSNSYFSGGSPYIMETPFGALAFYNVAAYSFDVTVPLGSCRSSDEVDAFTKAVEENYTVGDVGTEGCSVGDEETSYSSITLTFDMGI